MSQGMVCDVFVAQKTQVAGVLHHRQMAKARNKTRVVMSDLIMKACCTYHTKQLFSSVLTSMGFKAKSDRTKSVLEK